MSQPQPKIPAGTGKRVFDWRDPLALDDVLSEEERMVRDAAHEYCQEQLMPRVLMAHREESGSADIEYQREAGVHGLVQPSRP